VEDLTRTQVRDDLIGILKDLREDGDTAIVVTETTGIFRDFGLESIDAIGLSSTLEAHYGQTLPFPEFMAKAKEERLSDITVGRLVDFLMANLKGAEKGKVA
jgi:acyl carrier protein